MNNSGDRFSARGAAGPRDSERAGADEFASTAGPRDHLELVEHGIRIAVEAGADRATLAMVLDVLGVGAAR